jgi:excisionase family DNA binding protein
MSDHVFGSDLPPTLTETGKSIQELFLQDEYTPQELAALLDVPTSFIEHEAHAGRLKSYIVNHNVICIRRDDALTWMANRT